jgi:hypothetical protein
MKERNENKSILLELVRIICLVIGVPVLGLALSSGSYVIAAILLYLIMGGLGVYSYQEWKAGQTIRRIGVGLCVELALASIMMAIASSSVALSAAMLVVAVIFLGGALFLIAKPYLK